MSDRLPRLLGGSHRVDAVLIAASSADPAASSRALRALSEGGRIHRVGDDLLVVFTAPRRLRSEDVGATMLVRRGSVLASFTGADDACVAAPSGSILLLRSGQVSIVPPSAVATLDPAEIVDAGTLRIHSLPTLGGAPVVPIAAVREVATSMRSLFAIDASDDQRAFVDASSESSRSTSSVARLVDRASRFVGRLAVRAMIAIGLGLAALGLGGAPRPRGAAITRPAEPRSPSLLDRAAAWLSRRLVFLERLSGRQAKYLEDLLDQLDRGDFDAALKRAIPLGSGDGPSTRIALGVPNPRASLTIEVAQTAASSSIAITQDARTSLREGYERAFRALDRLGRHEEAAFVLAELLRENDRAVEYLVAHGRATLAAEVAEARGLDPARVVELWFRAGDRRRAIAIARRTGSFLAAITRLDRARDPHAEALRIEYAEMLARSGDLLRAAEIAWPVAAARSTCRGWLELGMSAGGAAGARCWSRFLTLPDLDVDDVRERLLPSLAARDQDGADFRIAFAKQAVVEPIGPLGSLALARTYRGLLRDRTELGRDVDRLVREVESKLGDPVLVADSPTFSARPAREPRLGPRRFEPLEAGTFEVHDAVHLPNGRTLVALGAFGLRILGRNGRTETEFDVPAHGLVLDERGERAVIVGRAANARRLHRLDLTTRRLSAWIETDAYLVAGTFDGECLYVVRGDGLESTLVCLDVLADEATALHTVDGLHYVADLCVTSQELGLVTLAPGPERRDADASSGGELFTFSLPTRVLRARRPWTNELPRPPGSGNTADGGARATHGTKYLDVDPTSGRQLIALPGDDGFLVGECAAGGDSLARPLLSLADVDDATLRVHGRTVTVSDARGRVVVLDRQTLEIESAIVVC